MSRFGDWLKGDQGYPVPVSVEPEASGLTSAAFPLQGGEVESYVNQYDLTATLSYMLNGGNGGLNKVAWGYYRSNPELHFLVSLLANNVGKVRLYAAKSEPGLKEPEELPESHPASQLLASFAGGTQGQVELLNRLAMRLIVVGDSIVVGPQSANAAGVLPYPFDAWRVFASDEVYSSGEKIFLRSNGQLNRKDLLIPVGSEAVRVWRPAPDSYWSADSAVLASFGVLGEIQLLDQHIRATALSRLRGAGLLAIPEEITLATSETEIDGLDADPFIRNLVEVMSVAIKNPESAAALVPVILRGPAEYIDKVKHFDFSTVFDAEVADLRDKAIRRLALGLDCPPEILLGSSDASSWSMWQVSAQLVDSHIVPLSHLITGSLTIGWFQNALKDLGVENSDEIVIWPDFSQLRVAIDESADLQALHDRGLISDEAFVHAMGFSLDKMPTAKQTEYQILVDLVKNNVNLAGWAISLLKEDFNIPFSDLPPEIQATERITVQDPGVPGPQGQPPATPTAPAPVASAPKIPGARSQAKQSGKAPTPVADGDGNNNVPGGAS